MKASKKPPGKSQSKSGEVEAVANRIAAAEFDGGYDSVLLSPVCCYCIHWQPNDQSIHRCTAYTLIPLDIWTGENPHMKAVEGDKGTRFELNPKFAVASGE